MGIYIKGDFKNPYPNCDECIFGELIQCEAVTRREVYDYEVDCPLSEIEVSEDAISLKDIETTLHEWLADKEMATFATKVLRLEAPRCIPQPKEGEWIIHKINGIPHTVECSHCHQHYDYEELRHLGRSKGCIDIPHCPNCGAKMKGADNE